jgi:hypothetical protein
VSSPANELILLLLLLKPLLLVVDGGVASGSKGEYEDPDDTMEAVGTDVEDD